MSAHSARAGVLLAVSMAWATLAAEPRAKAPEAALVCEWPNDCSIYPRDCCSGCEGTGDEAALRARDAVAYRGEWVDAHGQPGCEGKTCARCDAPSSSRAFPACERARCVVKDVDALHATQCTADAQCAVWVPSCCACGWDGAIAVRKDAVQRLRGMACAPGTGCGRCATTSPAPATVCRNKRCELAPAEPKPKRPAGR